MTPHPEIRPYINDHCGEAWLMVPAVDAAGGLVLHRIPLCLDGAIRLTAEAARAVEALARHRHRTATDSADAITATHSSD